MSSFDVYVDQVWVDPSGVIHDCTQIGHLGFAYDLFDHVKSADSFDPSEEFMFKIMMEWGWVQAGVMNRTKIVTYSKKELFSDNFKNSIKPLIEKWSFHGVVDEFYVSTLDSSVLWMQCNCERLLLDNVLGK